MSSGTLGHDPVGVSAQAFDRLAAQVLEQDAADRDGQLIALQTRRGQQVLDQADEAVALPLHPFQELLAQDARRRRTAAGGASSRSRSSP